MKNCFNWVWTKIVFFGRSNLINAHFMSFALNGFEKLNSGSLRTSNPTSKGNSSFVKKNLSQKVTSSKSSSKSECQIFRQKFWRRFLTKKSLKIEKVFSSKFGLKFLTKKSLKVEKVFSSKFGLKFFTKKSLKIEKVFRQNFDEVSFDENSWHLTFDEMTFWRRFFFWRNYPKPILILIKIRFISLVSGLQKIPQRKLAVS